MKSETFQGLFNYRYRIEKKLGEGAQGAVHLVTDTVTNRQVAIKVLHVGQSDQWQTLFRHEFEILADLSHPNLAQVHDFGVTSEGQVFFTRDYIPGNDLLAATSAAGGDDAIGTAICARGFVAVCVQMCRALRPLHRSGLIHGDIKPGNLVFGKTRKSSDGRWHSSAYPIDFSFVRAASGQAPPRGTLQYIAPEILARKPVDVRADLYALGATIYEAACGTPPFEPDISAIMAAHREGRKPEWQVTRICDESDAERRILNGLESIVHRLLASNPNDRFPDIDELEAALTALCPDAVAEDTESYIPGRNVLTGSGGLSGDSISGEVFAAMRECLEKPADNGLFVVEGEAGAGRSVVRKSVKWQAQLQGIHVLETHFYGDAEWFASVRELLLQAATVMGGTPDEQECLEVATQLVEFGNTRLDFHRVSSTVMSLILKASQIRPILVTMDNLDRACGEMLTILRGLLAVNQKGARVAILATSVPEFDWQNALGTGRVYHIRPLGEPEIARLVEQYLSVDGMLLAPKILEHTGGNPLFVTQLLHNCILTEKSPESVIDDTVVTDVESYWQMRLSELSNRERVLLQSIAVLGRYSDLATIQHVAHFGAEAVATVHHLEQQRWLKQRHQTFGILSTSLANQILRTLSDGEWRDYSARAFEAETAMEPRLLHAARIGQIDFLNAHALPTVRKLEQQGALSMACRVLQQIVECDTGEPLRTEATIAYGRNLIAIGELERARRTLVPLKDSDNPLVRQSALRLLGKIAVQQSALDDATLLLKEALNIDGSVNISAKVYFELCEIEYRRGRHPEAIEYANRGLDLLDDDDHHRCNLLCSKAKASAALGNHDVAMLLVDEAQELARGHQEKQMLAIATDIRSWVIGLTGNIAEATTELEKAAALYREIGDTSHLARSLQIIGNNYWWLEKWSLMLKNHEEALHVVASLDNPVGRNEQLIAYGYALMCVGRFEKAGLIFQRARSEAARIDDRFQQAKLAAYEGNWNAWQGYYDEALIQWKEGIQRFEQLSAHAVIAELSLEMAGALISRNYSADLLAAEKWIEKAKRTPREDEGRQFEYLLMLTEGRFRIANGGFEEGARILNELLSRLSEDRNQEMHWQASYYLAVAHLDRGMKLVARKQLRQAETSLNRLSVGLPTEHRVSFWQDTRRAAVKRHLEQFSSEQLYDSAQFDVAEEESNETAKLYKVLEFNKRISREANVNVLTEEILDSAIELTGAERGFFLAKGRDGMAIRAARQLQPETDDSPFFQFSTSIAESVFLDNEPVLTTDAAKDPRFNEFLSIHHLQIRSVACLPISFRSEVLGVLYLENRLSRGKFDHGDMRVLAAFADQMAIALAHASVLEEKNRIHEHLEETATRLNEMVAQQSEDLKSKQAGLDLANEQLQRIRNRIATSGNYHGMVGTGPAMQKVFKLIERVKDTDIPVVITGRSGTGKDLVARVIHEAGKRSSGPFVSLPCGSIPETLVESTLFGYRKGAFSGAQLDNAGILAAACGGTLYLDDVAEMPLRMQVDLLRVLQEGAYTPLGDHRKFTIDFRILCSSKLPLEQLVETGRLREDLFYRLQVISISLPDLKDRLEDVPFIAANIARTEAGRLGLPWSGFSPDTLTQYSRRPWPGNIRELEQEVRRQLIVGNLDDGHDSLKDETSALKAPISRTRENEREQMMAALEKSQWNKTRAAQLLGMPRRTFYRRLKEYDIIE